jgi:hypothetical protein
LESAASFATYASRKNFTDHSPGGSDHCLVNNDWASKNTSKTANESLLNLWFVDFPTEHWEAGTTFTFTCFWERDQRWQGQNWQMEVL